MFYACEDLFYVIRYIDRYNIWRRYSYSCRIYWKDLEAGNKKLNESIDFQLGFVNWFLLLNVSVPTSTIIPRLGVFCENLNLVLEGSRFCGKESLIILLQWISYIKFTQKLIVYNVLTKNNIFMFFEVLFGCRISTFFSNMRIILLWFRYLRFCMN